MNHPIQLCVPVTIKPEHREAMRKMIVELAADSRLEPGNLQYSLYDVEGEPDRLVIMELWRSQEDLDKHMAMDYFKAFASATGELLAEPLKVMALRELKH